MLIKSELDDDIANTDIDMFLTTDKVVKAEFLRRGEMTLDSTQVLKDKQFHLPIYILQFASNKFFISFCMKLIIVQEIIFNGIFGNLRNKKKIMEMKNLWCSSYTYLLLHKSSRTVREFKLLSTISEEDHRSIDIDDRKEASMIGTTDLHSRFWLVTSVNLHI